MIRSIVFIALALMLGGCVAGQNIALDYKPYSAGATAQANASPYVLKVEDKRTFVVSGEKQPFYIGHLRGGYGNTFDVTTNKKVPLADQMSSDINEELNVLGYKESDGVTAKRINVEIINWNFDAMINGRVWYDVQITVLSKDGRVLAESSVKDEVVVQGSFWLGSKGAMTRQVPIIYNSLIRKLVGENPQVMAALEK